MSLKNVYYFSAIKLNSIVLLMAFVYVYDLGQLRYFLLTYT